jgi:hypothetical protein
MPIWSSPAKCLFVHQECLEPMQTGDFERCCHRRFQQLRLASFKGISSLFAEFLADPQCKIEDESFLVDFIIFFKGFDQFL